MKQVAAYTKKNECGEEEFFTMLSYGCEFPVEPSLFFEQDIPCPLHEEQRYLNGAN